MQKKTTTIQNQQLEDRTRRGNKITEDERFIQLN